MVKQSMFCFHCGKNDKNTKFLYKQCGCFISGVMRNKLETTERMIVTDYFYLGLRYSRVVNYS